MTSRNGLQQPTAYPTESPQVTLTVYDSVTPTPTRTRQAVVRMAMQPTPQATATPKTYTVRENDTLLDIAIQFGITVEELQAANPEADPRALQIGQVLLIPDENNPTAPVLMGAPPPPLPIRAPNCYGTPTNSTICLGTLINDQERPVEQAQVAVQVIGNDGRVLEERITTIEQNVIPVGQHAPYRVLFAGIPEEEVAGVVASLSSATLADDLTGRYVPLQVENEVLNQQNNLWTLTADIVNTSEQTARAPRAVLTLYDETYQAIGYRVWQSSTDLAPSQRALLQVSVQTLRPELTPDQIQHTLHLEARIAEPIN